jgi:hypothetical protein
LIDINPNSKFINSMGQENFTDSQKVPAQLLARAEQSNPVNPALHQAQEQNLPVEPRIQAPHSTKPAGSENTLFKGINTWLQSFYSKNKTQVDKFDQFMLDDSSKIRKVLSLENELAEALEPSMKQLKVPEGISKFIYKGLWALCYLMTGTRMFIEAVKNGDAISGIKKLVQDFISIITLTTYFARALNWVQDKVEDAIGIPSIVKNLLRPFITVVGCGKAIDYFDKIGRPAGDFVVDYLRKISSGQSSSKQSNSSPEADLNLPAVIPSGSQFNPEMN